MELKDMARAQVLADAVALKAEIARLQENLKVMQQWLADSVDSAPGKHQTASGSFTVRQNNTYSDDVMVSLLLPGQIRRCSVSRLDKAAVKRLYPDVYQQAVRPNGVSVVIH